MISSVSESIPLEAICSADSSTSALVDTALSETIEGGGRGGGWREDMVSVVADVDTNFAEEEELKEELEEEIDKDEDEELDELYCNGCGAAMVTSERWQEK